MTKPFYGAIPFNIHRIVKGPYQNGVSFLDVVVKPFLVVFLFMIVERVKNVPCIDTDETPILPDEFHFDFVFLIRQ